MKKAKRFGLALIQILTESLSVIVIVVAIAVCPAAPPCHFQIAPFLLRLLAVFAMVTDCVLQIAFRFSDVAFALVVTINSVHRDDTTCQEKCSHQGHDHSLAFDLFKHSSPSVTLELLFAEAATRAPVPVARHSLHVFRLPVFDLSWPNHCRRVTPV
jgi:hypothetical protein